MRRILLIAAALAIPLSAMSLAMTSGVASAKGGPKPPKGKTTCSSLSGTVSAIVISGCVDASGANTGGGTPPFSGSVLASGGTVTWNSGFTSTSTAPTLTSTSSKKCPGYVKGGANNPTADKVSATVSASTVGFKVPGLFKGAVCISSSGAITNLGPLKVS
jgi:hypothetical protein